MNYQKLHDRLISAALVKNGSSEIFLEGAKEITGAGFNHKHVSACCLGKRKSHAGYTWEYI